MTNRKKKDKPWYFRDFRSLPPLSLGTTSIKALRQNGQIYVDKTSYIQNLLKKGSRYFFTRPRGFGKTLLISVLEAYFRADASLFAGLDIGKGGFRHKSYSVVVLDFALVSNFEKGKDFSKSLKKYLGYQFGLIGFEFKSDSKQNFWDQLKEWLGTLHKRSVVLLIDNYDAPFAACLIKTLCKERVTSELSAFYKVITDLDSIWRFCWISGNSNVGRQYVMDACEKFRDVSSSRDTGSLLGFTDIEIMQEEYFMPFVRNSLFRSGFFRSKDHIHLHLLHWIRSYYGGYNFCVSEPIPVYDPWSLLNYLYDLPLEFPNYRPGTFLFPSWLEKFVFSQPLDGLPEGYKVVNLFDFQLTNAFEHERFNLLSLLTQLGYLTIAFHSKAMVSVSYPNQSTQDFLTELKEFKTLEEASAKENGRK